MSDTITIPKQEYYDLRCDSERLSMLECGGVDNWVGCWDSLYGEKPDIDEICEDIYEEVFGVSLNEE